MFSFMLFSFYSVYRNDVIANCCKTLTDFCNPCENEDMRLSAARFLHIAGKTILDYGPTISNNENIEEAVVRYFVT